MLFVLNFVKGQFSSLFLNLYYYLLFLLLKHVALRQKLQQISSKLFIIKLGLIILIITLITYMK